MASHQQVDAPLVAWLAEFANGERIWSGDGELTFGGQTFSGTNVVLSAAEVTVGAPQRRLTAAFSIAELSAQEKAVFLTDPGPLTVTVRWLRSSDQGQSWLAVPRSFVGRLSRPVIRDGIYSIEIETYTGDIDRGRPLMWSDEDQRARVPGDRGLEYMRQLASGIETKWPP